MKRILILLCITFTMTNQLSAQDWANLSRYQKFNESIKNTHDENRVVFMGNSITEGWLNHRPEFFDEHPAFINRGISGQTTPQMLIRFKQDVVSLQPRAVVILAGINDIAGNTGPSTLEMISDNISSMVEIAQANGIKVVLCSVLPAFDFPWNPGLEPATKVIALNDMLMHIAKKRNIVYVDYWSAMANENKGLSDHLGYDGVHPNATGYLIMEPLVLKGIEKALR